MVLHDIADPLSALPALLAAPPDPNSTPIPGLANVSNAFIGWLKWLLMIGGVAGLLVCGIMMAIGRRNRSSFAAEGAGGIPWVIGGLSLGMVAAGLVGGVLGDGW